MNTHVEPLTLRTPMSTKAKVKSTISSGKTKKENNNGSTTSPEMSIHLHPTYLEAQIEMVMLNNCLTQGETPILEDTPEEETLEEIQAIPEAIQEEEDQEVTHRQILVSTKGKGKEVYREPLNSNTMPHQNLMVPPRATNDGKKTADYSCLHNQENSRQTMNQYSSCSTIWKEQLSHGELITLNVMSTE
jgi:hypothetical protein